MFLVMLRKKLNLKWWIQLLCLHHTSKNFVLDGCVFAATLLSIMLYYIVGILIFKS